MKQKYIKVKEKILGYIGKYIDAACFLLLALSTFAPWFPVDKIDVINAICMGTEFYLLYYGKNPTKFHRWAALNICFAFIRITYLLNGS